MSKLTVFRYLLHLGGVATAVVILTACYGFGYQPLRAGRQELHQRGQFTAQFAETRDAVQSRNRKLVADLGALNAEVDRLKTRLPSGSREDELLRELSRLAKTTNTQLLDFQPGAYAQAGDLRAAIVRINLRGPYAGICRFLSELKNARRMHQIVNFDLRSTDRRRGMVEVRIEIHAFYQPGNTSAI